MTTGTACVIADERKQHSTKATLWLHQLTVFHLKRSSMSTYDDDDIPLAVIKARSAGPSTVSNGTKSAESLSKRVVHKTALSAELNLKSKSISKDSKSKESKKADIKEPKVASEWADFNHSSGSASKKSKTWAEWARSNTPLLVFIGLVVIIVGCRCCKCF